MEMEHFKGKKVLIVGIGKTGFSLINFFNRLECEIRVTDIKPIFDLNKSVKKIKKIEPTPEMTFGEHKDEDFLEADVIVYSAAINPALPQLELARSKGKEVYSDFALAYKLCKKPIIAVCGSFGRTTIASMIGFTLKIDGKNTFVGGTSDMPFIEYCMLSNVNEIDYVVVEVSALQMKSLPDFHPKIVVLPNIGENFSKLQFSSVSEYMETKLSIVSKLTHDDVLVANYDALANNAAIRNATCQTYWYSRRSFVALGVMNEIQGTHFHDRRIHSNINYHSEFKVNKMRIVGQNNRENLMAAVTTCKALDASDEAIQTCIEKFPGIPNRLEFVMEKNGVSFYNDSKAQTMPEMIESLKSFKEPVILIAGGKDNEDLNFDPFAKDMIGNARVLVLVGECKERLNRALGDHNQTYIVGSFEESVLFAYQKSRTGDVILLSPGNPSSDSFRDYEERGNYFKKLVYQL
jgi:UDP-N-acetylmuramoylalanine--D-glutamate ligase